MRWMVLKAGAVVMLASGCSTAAEPSQVCTLIGCDDGITVMVQGEVPASYTLTARENGNVVATVQCNADTRCENGVFLRGVSAETVQLELRGGTVVIQRDVTPAYSISRPNGPRCEPACRQARVTLAAS